MSNNSFKYERKAGILLPVSSLPSPYGIGNLGKAAYDFIDYLKKARQKVWQILPIGPTSFGDSPYQSFSAYAGNPYFIDPDTLISEGLLKKEEALNFDFGNNESKIDYAAIYQSRFELLRIAFERFKKKPSNEFENFCKENSYWLENYSLYMAIKKHFNELSWLEWDEDIRVYKADAVSRYKEMLCEEIEFWNFTQFKFFEQWFKLKEYANKNGIKIIGDIPIYVSMDSADTWADSEQFLLDQNHNPTVVAGCPPDAFSDDGQLWGNSIYDYEFMEKDNFSGWKKRIEFSAKFYDVIRIDHFIGIVRYYTIPYGSTNAKAGEFRKGPAEKLTQAINSALGDSELIAEDLGIVIDAVIELMKKENYPGMKILQHAFDGNPNNEHLPCNYIQNSCVYLGTHDNDTMISAIENMSDEKKKFMLEYLNKDNMDDIIWDLIKLEYSSVAKLAVIQMQDLLELDNSARMNVPSTIGDNWDFRVTKSQLTAKLANKLARLTEVYAR